MDPYGLSMGVSINGSKSVVLSVPMRGFKSLVSSLSMYGHKSMASIFYISDMYRSKALALNLPTYGHRFPTYLHAYECRTHIHAWGFQHVMPRMNGGLLMRRA